MAWSEVFMELNKIKNGCISITKKKKQQQKALYILPTTHELSHVYIKSK